jgi:hypothetical protein
MMLRNFIIAVRMSIPRRDHRLCSQATRRRGVAEATAPPRFARRLLVDDAADRRGLEFDRRASAVVFAEDSSAEPTTSVVK